MSLFRALLAVLVALSSAGHAMEYPESRPLRLYPFHGTPLPDASPRDDESATEVGLYVGKGTWDTGKEHLKMFLGEHGHSYRSFTAAQIREGELATSGVRVLIVPGGESWQYLAELGDLGASAIRSFVQQGGGYIGICAGAFYATSVREGGYKTGPYGIGLLEGTAYDGTALKTAPFIEGMMDFDFPWTSLLNSLKDKYRIVLLGGPSFRYGKDEAMRKGIEVLSEFQGIREPAMITLHYGKGRVFLSGPHLEVEENRTDWGETFFDPESEWPILERVMAFLTP